ncbi:uncharacterized protein LOC128158867 [Crassostrea angulata]|uniref:uncharacterized protein LOC128158867 n=1 Tax=Magallana angulata TaxID=2784310 RepID=UPI0022B1A7D7|nr:uncharacterized protein LOC128158867 [Crassostrea angulata]
MQNFDMQYIVPEKEPLFNETIPLMQCMVLCLSMSSCLSVFVSNKNTCNGYHFTHRHPTGIQFHRSEDDSYFYKVHECNTPGYTWNSTHQYCYKYHTTRKTYEEARTACSQDDPRSHLFLVDSERDFVFLQYIIDLYGKIMYLQGIRKDRSSPLLNDFGGEMTFFMWDENEPIADSSRVYLRTNNLNPTSMKVTRGQMARHFLCFIM